MLFTDSHAQRALEIWSKDCQRVASRLLAFECQTIVQRYAFRLPDPLRKKWLAEAQLWLKKSLASLVMHEIDNSVLDKLRGQSALGNCRTLDAIHIASALIFADYATTFSLVTFDKKMEQVAKEVGLTVLN